MKPAAPRLTTRKARSGNRERIIETAARLMNEQGSVVGTSQIAESLGISPGNLYYHFRNMRDIVREILARMHAELGQTLHLPAGETVAVDRLVGYYSNGAMVLWRYRFMVSSALELTSGDAELEASYREFTRDGIEWVRRIIRNVVRHHPGPVKTTASDCSNLAENMWVLWNGWPRHAEYYREGDKVSQASIAHGLEQIAMTLAPYTDPAFHSRVKRGLHRFVESLEQGL